MSGRIRTIKPEWLEDERLLECSNDARLLSVGLIVLADDAGRGRWGVATRARVFPADPSVAHGALSELSPWYVRTYEVRGQIYFSICNWLKHQKINRPSKPRTPEPEEGRWLDDPAPGAPPPPQSPDTLTEGSVSPHGRTWTRTTTRTEDQGPPTEDLNSPPPPPSRAGARTHTRVREGPGQEHAAAAAESSGEGTIRVGELSELNADGVLELFGDAWELAHGERPPASRSNLRRAAKVLRWLAGVPPAQRFEALDASLRGAVTIRNADNPLAVWAADPADFARLTPAERPPDADRELELRERVSELVAKCDALDPDDPDDLNRMGELNEQIKQLRSQLGAASG